MFVFLSGKILCFFGQNLDISAIVLFNNKLGEQWAEMPGVDGLCHDKVGPFLN
jgi:hypothetical protein